MKYFSYLITILSCTLLCGCGGGGGSGGGNTGGSGSLSASAKTGVRLLHAVIDYAPVSLDGEVQGTVQIQQVSFAAPALYAGADEGTYSLVLHRGLSAAPLLTVPVTIADHDRKTVLFYGLASDNSLHARILSQEPPTLAEGQSAVRIINGLVGAATLMSTISEATVSTNLGDGSPYLVVPQGVTIIHVAKLNGQVVLSTTRTLEAGKIYSVLLAGQVGYFSTSVLYED